MKLTFAALLGAATALLAGCVVTSVCPFYTPKDVVFEPALLGDWYNTRNVGEFWNLTKSGPTTYRFTQFEPAKATVMEAHAFKLGGQLFVDVYSLKNDYHVIPAHYVLKVSQLGPNPRLAELDDDWLKDLLAKDPAALRHHLVKYGDAPTDQRVVLTAETSELQEFLVKHLKTGAAWKEGFQLRRDFAAKKDRVAGAVP